MIYKLVPAALSGCLLLLFSSAALGDVTAASKAFSEGQAAQLAENHEAAAQKFELANSIMPSAAALRSAARTRGLAGHTATAASHAATLLEEYPDDALSTEFANELLGKLGPELVRIEVSCESKCSVSSGGHAIGVNKQLTHIFYSRPGPTSVKAWFESGSDSSEAVDGQAGATLRLSFAPPAAAAGPPVLDVSADGTSVQKSAVDNSGPRKSAEPDTYAPNRPPRLVNRDGMHPAWFFVGAGLTAAGGAATTWFGLRARSIRSDFDDDPTLARFNKGKTQQDRTNIAGGATAAFGVATVIMAILTDWKGPRTEAGVELTANGFAGRF